MNPQHPVVKLTRDEAERVRTICDELGPEAARMALGNLSERTLMKAGAGAAVHRLTAEVIRGRLVGLDRI